MRYSYLLTSIVLLVSCKKDNDPVLQYPAIYHYTKTYLTSDVHIYTKQGEIKDQTVVKNFLNRYNEQWKQFSPKPDLVTTIDTVKLLSSREGQIPGLYSKNYLLQIRGEMMYFIEQDTFSYQEPFLYDVTRAIEKYKPIYEKRNAVSPSTGSNATLHILSGRYARFTASELRFPTLSYLLVRTKYTSTPENPNNPPFYTISYIATRYNNAFEPNSYKVLTTEDTLVIQESMSVYEK